MVRLDFEEDGDLHLRKAGRGEQVCQRLGSVKGLW